MYLQLPAWQGLQLKNTKASYHELEELGMDLSNVVNILENGYDCSRSKRREDLYERCVNWYNKTIKVVVVKTFDTDLDAWVWVVLHVGMFGRREEMFEG